MGCQKGLQALIFLTILQGYTSKVTFPIESSDNSPKFVRSLEVIDSSENDIFASDRKLNDEGRWNGWNFENEKQLSDPGEKTISVQLLDEDPYHHGRPAWPHDEYVLGLGLYDVNRTPQDLNNSTPSDVENVENNQEDLTKYYEWKRLRPRPSPSAFIGPGFYDVGASSNSYDTGAVSFSPDPYYRYQHHTSHRITTSEGSGKATGSSSSNAESVPGTPSESTTNTRHFPYVPHDYYKRKRLRLQIHPGLIAAPLAGLAAFGAASALTSKPLLLELGYVRNKPEIIGGGGWGWVGNVGSGYRPYPPFYPPPNPPPLLPAGTAALAPGGHGFGHGHASAGPIYPILKPTRGRPDADRGTSWWNPFSALTPRFVIGE